MDQIAEDLFLVLITATDPILHDATNPTTLAILRAAEARGMTYGRELDAPYGVVYLMDEQTRSATGIAERLEFRFSLEGAPWAELLARLEAAEVAADVPESVPGVDDCIVTERATYSLCADRLRVRAQDGGRGWILDAELAQAVREAFAQKRGADPLAVSLDWLEGTRLVRAALEFPVLVSGDGTEAYEMRAQTIEDAAALAGAAIPAPRVGGDHRFGLPLWREADARARGWAGEGLLRGVGLLRGPHGGRRQAL